VESIRPSSFKVLIAGVARAHAWFATLRREERR
jgi:hypothetical protein